MLFVLLHLYSENRLLSSSLCAAVCQNVYCKYCYFLTGFSWFLSILLCLLFFEISCLSLGSGFVWKDTNYTCHITPQRGDCGKSSFPSSRCSAWFLGNIFNEKENVWDCWWSYLENRVLGFKNEWLRSCLTWTLLVFSIMNVISIKSAFQPQWIFRMFSTLWHILLVLIFFSF